ncbi:MAG TPA: NUDIX domain-containing protein [Candidatus Saccharimonadales bacterium]|nr:NUDIX domain-containing protein [Candidatus Saccharimonadales bacterium]
MTADVTSLPKARKAICYVVRDGELLVFRHRDHPLAGVQVPAGTLHPDEPPAVGALREAEEETGRSGFRIARALGSTDYEFRNTAPGFERHEIHERHFFLLEPPAGLPDRWSHLAEEGNGDFWFEFFWVRLVPELVLAADQHACLDRIRGDEVPG